MALLHAVDEALANAPVPRGQAHRSTPVLRRPAAASMLASAALLKELPDLLGAAQRRAVPHRTWTTPASPPATALPRRF